jgi:YidC/Oxa1 family membrane protein insertase
MGWFSGIGHLLREMRGVQTLLSLPRNRRRVVVYSEDVSSYIQFEGYLNELLNRFQHPIVYVTSSSDDPLFTDHHPLMSVHYLKKTVPTWVPKVDSEIFVTTMPDLGKLHIPRPTKTSCCLYIFHSLNSTHEVYRKGAFDHYDEFFCAGPHHKKELETHFEREEIPQPVLHEVGYYKLDRIAKAHQNYEKKSVRRTTVLIAPSWGKHNLLEAQGAEIVSRLLGLGLQVVVRPHPCFFLPIYPRGREIVESIERQFGDHPNWSLERNIDTEDSFHEADLMLSDYSGAAFEYALGTLRPVLFIDGPRKTLNPDWRNLGLPTFEDTMRHRVGRVFDPGNISRLDRLVEEMLLDQTTYRQKLDELRRTAVYNFGRSADIGAQIIDDRLTQSDGAETGKEFPKGA